jgi:hypothetical protein
MTFLASREKAELNASYATRDAAWYPVTCVICLRRRPTLRFSDPDGTTTQGKTGPGANVPCTATRCLVSWTQGWCRPRSCRHDSHC